MKPQEYQQARVPIAYVLLSLELAADRGIARETLLDGLDLDPGLLREADSRIPLLTYGHIVARSLRLSNDASLGYAFGLRNQLTTHGLLGLGLMSQPTLGDAIELCEKYLLNLRSPGFTSRFAVQGDQAILEVHEAVPFGPLRQYAFDMLLVSAQNMLRQIAPAVDIELCFDCAQPEYYQAYRAQLPPTRFNCASNQLRLPLDALGMALPSANTSTTQLIHDHCEQELRRLGTTDTLLGRVRALLVNTSDRYLSLDEIALLLGISNRTLKRRLQEQARSYQQLLNEARRRDSIRMLEDTTLPLDEIAHRLGYSEASNFTRAFRRWTGQTPSGWRHAGQARVSSR